MSKKVKKRKRKSSFFYLGPDQNSFGRKREEIGDQYMVDLPVNMNIISLK